MLIYGRKKMNKDILPEDFYKKNLFYDCGDKSMKARLGFLLARYGNLMPLLQNF